MKSETIIQQKTFCQLMQNLGIDQIEVIDPEIVSYKESDFRKWYFRLGGNGNFTELQIATGWQNHLAKWNKNKCLKQ